jgi:hypothetical protein
MEDLSLLTPLPGASFAEMDVFILLGRFRVLNITAASFRINSFSYSDESSGHHSEG